jgi:hypothetical protein
VPSPGEAGLAGLHDVLGTAVHAVTGTVREANGSELRGQHRFVATRSERRPEELLVVPEAIHVRSIEERDPQVEGALDGRDRLGGLAWAVHLGHADTSQTERRYGEAGCSERSKRHGHRDASMVRLTVAFCINPMSGEHLRRARPRSPTRPDR